MNHILSPVARIWNLVREERSDITGIYFYAVLNGLIQLSLPVGIQAIIGFILAGTLSASLVLLISLIIAGVLLVGLMQINQMKIIEKIQQKIFVRYAYAFADHIPRLDLKKVDSFYLPELVNRFFDTIALQKKHFQTSAGSACGYYTNFFRPHFALILPSFLYSFWRYTGIVIMVNSICHR